MTAARSTKTRSTEPRVKRLTSNLGELPLGLVAGERAILRDVVVGVVERVVEKGQDRTNDERHDEAAGKEAEGGGERA